MNRRSFIKNIGLGVLGTQTFPGFTFQNAIHSGNNIKTKVPLGICNHSLRSMNLTVKQLIEFAIAQNLDSVLINTFHPFKSLAASFLSEISKLAKENNISIYVGIGSISEHSLSFSDTYGNASKLLIEGIRVASLLNSPVVGCRIGSIKDRYLDGGIEAHIEEVINIMSNVRTRALDVGVKFAFENHMGDLRSIELNTIITETGTDVCGALFDSANALWAMEDPINAFDTLGKYIICTSMRDVAIWETPEGATFQGMAIGDGILDFHHISQKLSDLCPGVPIHVETISNRSIDIPYLKSEFWKGFPDLSADQLIDFLILVKTGNRVQKLKPPVGVSQQDFDSKLQELELKKSFNFLRNCCNVGIKS